LILWDYWSALADDLRTFLAHSGVFENTKQAELIKKAESFDSECSIHSKDYAEAVHWYRKAAEQGLAEAQWSLSVAYANGKSVPKDHAEVTRWRDKAEEQKDALAQRDLWPGVCQRAVNQPDPKPQRNN
jgi:TPR repeat protein